MILPNNLFLIRHISGLPEIQVVLRLLQHFQIPIISTAFVEEIITLFYLVKMIIAILITEILDRSFFYFTEYHVPFTALISNYNFRDDGFSLDTFMRIIEYFMLVSSPWYMAVLVRFFFHILYEICEYLSYRLRG